MRPIVSPSPRWPDAVRGSGLDFVFIDTEHIALDRAQLSWMCQTSAALGLPPIVRIPSPDPYAATLALDGGAAGVVAPYVETPAQVQALRGAVKLRPIKGRKLEQILGGTPVEPALDAYLKNGTNDRLLIVNIESAPAIQALKEILAVPGLDAVLIGPHDLSCNLGVPERYDHPDFLGACETIFLKARAFISGARSSSRRISLKRAPTCSFTARTSRCSRNISPRICRPSDRPPVLQRRHESSKPKSTFRPFAECSKTQRPRGRT